MYRAFVAALMLAAGCSSPTAPSHARMTLAISRASLPVGGTAVVTATLVGLDRGLVSFSSSVGTFAPPQAYAADGVVTTTFTATRSGLGMIGALAGSVSAEPLNVRIGDFAVERVILRAEGAVPTVGIVASAQDVNGTPVPGAAVRFALTGAGALSASSATTNSDGDARVTVTAASAGTRVVASVGTALADVALGQPLPTVSVSCNTVGVAGVPLVCAVSSGFSVQNVVINWGDESPDQSIGLATTAAHVYSRAGRYNVSARGFDGSGQIATATATATVNAPTPPPPPVTPPAQVTSVFVSQEADVEGGCAVFAVSATAATGTAIAAFWIEKNGVKEKDLTPPSERVAICGLVIGNVVTGKVTDSNGRSASYPVIVK